MELSLQFDDLPLRFEASVVLVFDVVLKTLIVSVRLGTVFIGTLGG